MGNRRAEVPVAGKPPGNDRDMGAGRGRQRGDKGVGYDDRRRHAAQVVNQAAEAGGGWCGQRPGGRSYVPVKEVGSGCK